MNIPKISSSHRHEIWCENFIKEQNKSTKLARSVMRKTRVYSPFSDNAINNILKRYEKSFWG